MQPKAKCHIFQKENKKKKIAARRNVTLNLDFCHSMILGHWSSGFKNQDGEWASQNDSQTMIMSCPACGCGAWLLALPQPSEQSSFNSVLKFGTSYEILTQKGFFYKEKKKKEKSPSFHLTGMSIQTLSF